MLSILGRWMLMNRVMISAVVTKGKGGDENLWKNVWYAAVNWKMRK